MAHRGKPSGNKRQRERSKQRKREVKEERRKERRELKAAGGAAAAPDGTTPAVPPVEGTADLGDTAGNA